jgi:hypothetical protein
LSRGVVYPSQFNIAVIVVVILAMLTPILMKVALKNQSTLLRILSEK